MVVNISTGRDTQPAATDISYPQHKQPQPTKAPQIHTHTHTHHPCAPLYNYQDSHNLQEGMKFATQISHLFNQRRESNSLVSQVCSHIFEKGQKLKVNSTKETTAFIKWSGIVDTTATVIQVMDKVAKGQNGNICCISAAETKKMFKIKQANKPSQN